MTTTLRTARFAFESTPLSGVWLVRRQPIADTRGFFARMYCAEEFAAIGLTAPLAQINHSFSRQAGTVRGLHFQHPPHHETKIVSCPAGRIFDVAVDLRRGSPTFLQWFGAELSAENQCSLVVPPGFAHGFQTLCEDSQTLYAVTAPYSGAAEDGVNPFDPAVGVAWPLAAREVSPRDAQRAAIDRAVYAGIDWPWEAPPCK
jgi:dTDP-4-dehydrorhamnose 3,5-epimerase